MGTIEETIRVDAARLAEARSQVTAARATLTEHVRAALDENTLPKSKPVAWGPSMVPTARRGGPWTRESRPTGPWSGWWGGCSRWCARGERTRPSTRPGLRSDAGRGRPSTGR